MGRRVSAGDSEDEIVLNSSENTVNFRSTWPCAARPGISSELTAVHRRLLRYPSLNVQAFDPDSWDALRGDGHLLRTDSGFHGPGQLARAIGRDGRPNRHGHAGAERYADVHAWAHGDDHADSDADPLP